MIKLDELNFIGKDLSRPECVLVDSKGDLHIADWRGGVTIIRNQTESKTIVSKSDFKLKPNGIAILRGNEGWLVTHLGDVDGGVFHLSPEGRLEPFLLEIDKTLLPPTNYVHVDHLARTWITVSTRLSPRILGCRPDHADGFIVLVDNLGPRIVADNLGYTNECIVDPHRNRLYVNETFGRRLSYFDIKENGSLSNKKVFFEFEFGEFPDGLTFDSEGGIWITSIVSNRVIRISPEGKKQIILEDNTTAHLDWVENAFLNSSLERKHLDTSGGNILKNISSLAFGGKDMKTAFLGCLQGESIIMFRSEIAGARPAHWEPKALKELCSK
ncbi:MAG: SMP-30/gluconolactonase/LRE family protein [Paracoccaceae bacterium]|nr:SMP-30/gluconolactonase/LRE family protein [Paracoccaceae bacterium]